MRTTCISKKIGSYSHQHSPIQFLISFGFLHGQQIKRILKNSRTSLHMLKNIGPYTGSETLRLAARYIFSNCLSLKCIDWKAHEFGILCEQKTCVLLCFLDSL